ncbi:glycosyltransferase family 2 protein [Jannaschia sp. M317]|uniref:glycosyltransferase family 2 protein n=1 Tax=Jannaschia sp. M317 TaxID=2867011 RepID=UPI0021A8543A|nr:glycosyltransferase family 2 protein [Jannaschia sp. M317]UWQ16496.1 glycosyltransferase family 2 protein [Jannaschia sp. M317]
MTGSSVTLRHLCGSDRDGVRLLDVLVGARSGDGHPVWLTFAGGTPVGRLTARNGLNLQDATRVQGGLLVRARWTGGTALPLPLDGPAATVSFAQPEPEIMAGRRVLLAVRGAETPRDVADWLRYHAAQGCDGAVILDLSGTLASDLRAALAHGIAGPDRVVIVTSPLPLSASDGTLAEPIVLEALRWRFLQAASAVIHLRVSDVLAEASADTFAQTLAAAEFGALPLTGRAIVPWAVPRGEGARHGDHCCIGPDTPGLRSWACDPARLPAQAPWRTEDIGGLDLSGARALTFDRALYLDAGTVGPSNLRADPGLVRRARRSFDHMPLLPDSDASPALPAALPGRILLVSAVDVGTSDDALLAWVAQHRQVGVDDLLVYDCGALPVVAERLAQLHAKGVLRTLPAVSGSAARQSADSHPLRARAGWVMWLDIGTVLTTIPPGPLAAVLPRFGMADLIAMDAPDGQGPRCLCRNLPPYQALGAQGPEGMNDAQWSRQSPVDAMGHPWAPGAQGATDDTAPLRLRQPRDVPGIRAAVADLLARLDAG